MLPDTTLSIAISIAGLSIVGLLSIPALYQNLDRLRATKARYQEVSDLYEDQDGEATEQSTQAYSDFLPRWTLILFSSVASIDALVTAILTITSPHVSLILEQWLQFGSWVPPTILLLPLYLTNHF